MHKDNAPRMFLVLMLSIVVLFLAGAAMIMGSMIYQFSRGEKLFAEKSAHTESDSLKIHQSSSVSFDDVAGADAAATVNHATVVVRSGESEDMGVIISANGYLITSAAISGEAVVELDDGTEAKAGFVALDEASGIALYKIGDGKSLRAAFFAGETPPVGSRLYKISWLEGEFALFEGIVSAERQVSEEMAVVISDIPKAEGGFSIFVNSRGEMLAAGSYPVDALRSAGASAEYIEEYLGSLAAD